MSTSNTLPQAARAQRGAAALIVTLLLFFAMVLGAAYVNRNLVFEQRIATNQVRSTLAFEAAEAGLEWAIAQLNNPQRLGPDCLPTTDPSATSFRTRHLSFNRGDASFTPATWVSAGTPTALRPSCVRSGAGWACSCPASGAPLLGPASSGTPEAAFTLRFTPTGKPGLVRVSATGCTSLGGACLDGSTSSTDATATLDVVLGLLPGLRTPPAAALTLRGPFDADTATLGVHNPDPATGIAIHAGGAIAAGHARLTVPAGASTAAALVGNDTALASLSPDRFFAAIFGLDKAGWKNQPNVTRIDCSADCSGALAADSALIWVDGDLTITGPLALGSAQRPVVLVVNGAIRLDGAVALSGLIYGASMRWDSTGGGATLRGAAIAEGGYQGNGAPELFYDTAVLAALHGNSGSFARVSGSWRDF